MSRSYAELLGLEVEAERQVRSGESRAEVSRRLGVHPQTLAGWALRGNWRKKDLDLERANVATRKTLQAIRLGNQRVDAQNALRAQLAGLMREAVELLADGGDEALEELDRRLSAMAAPKRLARPEEARGPERGRGLADFGLADSDPDKDNGAETDGGTAGGD